MFINSAEEQAGLAALPEIDSWDVVHFQARPDQHYCTANIGEAIPGVQTPLSWSVWGRTIERAARQTFHDVGAFTRAERDEPANPADRITQIFHGRTAFRLEGLATLGDRLPGTTGPEVIAGMCGEAPADLAYAPTRRRYPVVALAMPYQMMRVVKRLPAIVTDTDTWYRKRIAGAESGDLRRTQALIEEATRHFFTNIVWQMTALSCAIQPLYDLIQRLTERTGVGDPLVLTSGYGGVPETALVADLWAASRDRIPLSAVVAKHGFHGPLEGELSSRVWREDDDPLRRLMADYGNCDESRDPRHGDQERWTVRISMERAVEAAVPWAARPVVRQLFGTAGRIIPQRGAAKNAFLQAFDVIRAGARHAGALLVAEGRLAEVDDVFFLTYEELTAPAVTLAAEIVERRKARHGEYRKLRLPEAWTGVPVPEPLDLPAVGARPGLITGTGVSPGTVEGRVRVVDDPAFVDIEPAEILVATTTDPSWSSIMFVSAGLVVDIGGVMSHAAVVARDLGIPCVVNTRQGSRLLRTGDHVRLDGGRGIVEVLRPVDGEADHDPAT